MTRRNKSKLPPKLPDPVRERAAAPQREDSPREQLKRARVSGRSTEFGREEILGVMRRVERNDARAMLGLARFDALTAEQVRAAVASEFGWIGDGPRARIAPERTVDAFSAACARVLEVARNGGTLAFATSSPASLFTLHRELARCARDAGGRVYDATESTSFRGRDAERSRLRWVDQVAMVTDGRALLGDDVSGNAAEELLFAVGHPDVLVADRTFAGRALSSGLEVIAFADLDAVALAVAAWRGMAIRIVPLDERRPPDAYRPLLRLLGEHAEGPEDPERAVTTDGAGLVAEH